MFNQLKGCRVIEGFLMISLIERYNETNYDNLTFPKLTEITEFFILYRVQGLKTLANLFPNLRIIRGNSLIADFSFIIYEMMHLQVSVVVWLFLCVFCVFFFFFNVIIFQLPGNRSKITNSNCTWLSSY